MVSKRGKGASKWLFHIPPGSYEASDAHRGVDPNGFPEKRNGEQMRQVRIQMAF